MGPEVKRKVGGRLSEQLKERIDARRPHSRNFGKDGMERADFQRTVQGYCDRMHRRTRVPQPDVAALLTDHGVPNLLQRTNQTFASHAARQLHAASTGINSSFT